MEVLKQIAALVGWFFLWFAIPSALLYPLAIWLLNHTHISENAVVNSYFFGIALLWLPTAFLVDFFVQRFLHNRASRNLKVQTEPPPRSAIR